MIWLYVFIAIVLALGLFALLKIHLTIAYKSDFFVTLRFCGINFSLYPACPKKRFKHTESKRATAPQNVFEKLKKRGVIESFKFIFCMMKLCKNALMKIISKTNIDKFVLKVWVGSPYASQCAVKYGEACATIYPVVSFITSSAQPKEYLVNIVPDFLSEKTTAEFYMKINIRIIDLIITAFALISKYKEII